MSRKCFIFENYFHLKAWKLHQTFTLSSVSIFWKSVFCLCWWQTIWLVDKMSWKSIISDSVCFQTNPARGEVVWRDLHCAGLWRGECDQYSERSPGSGHDDRLPQLPHHQPGPAPGRHGGVQVRRHQHHRAETCWSLQRQRPGTDIFVKSPMNQTN